VPKKGQKGKRISTAKYSTKMKNVDLREYVSPLLIKELEKKYDTICMTPTMFVICTCKERKNQKIFAVLYATAEDFKNKIVQIQSTKKISKTDKEKLRRAFNKAKIKGD